MKHTPEQIVSLLRQIEVAVANRKTTGLACKEAAITEQTYYRWRKEFGGLRVDQARRPQELELENAKLKHLMAIRESGPRCPQNVFLTDLDDLDFAETTAPSLSSVSQSRFQLGAGAARVLLDRFEGDQRPARHFVIETTLKIRHPVAPPANAIEPKPVTKRREPRTKPETVMSSVDSSG
jgi:hypothetical protein